jgi:predicted phage terminase large subunit-like protein
VGFVQTRRVNLPSIEHLDAELGRRSLREFVRLAWRHIESVPFVDGDHIRVLCEDLEDLYFGRIRNLVENLPPGMSKSTICSVLWPVWCWIQDPSLVILSLSYSLSNATRDATKSLKLIHDGWFQARWPHVRCAPNAAVAECASSAGGWRYAFPTAGQIMGKHPDIIIIDDPIAPKDVTPLSLVWCREVFWRQTLSSRRRDPNTVRRVCTMQRIHVEDLSGYFERQGWTVRRLPMRFESAHADPKDWRTTEGELLCPERSNEQATSELERDMGGQFSRTAQAQLQQRPVPEGGAIIKSDWIQWVDRLPEDALGMKLIQSWDLAFKGSDTSDFVAGQAWRTDGVRFYFVDGILEHLDLPATIAAILKMHSDHPETSETLIEDKANGPAVMSVLGDKISGIVAVNPDGGKVARVNAAAPSFQANQVFLLRCHPIAEALAISLASFPAGSHDDDVDACTQVINHCRQQVADYQGFMERMRELGLVPR